MGPGCHLDISKLGQASSRNLELIFPRVVTSSTSNLDSHGGPCLHPQHLGSRGRRIRSSSPCTCICICVSVYLSVHMYVCVYLSMHMYVYVCVCRHVLHMCVVLRNESQAFPMLHSALLLSYTSSPVQSSSCLCLLSAGIKGVRCHCLALLTCVAPEDPEEQGQMVHLR